MAANASVRKAVQRLMVIVFSALEILGLPRVPGKARPGEGRRP